MQCCEISHPHTHIEAKLPLGYRHPSLVVMPVAGKGRGIFLTEPVTAGEVLEVCPVVPLKETEELPQTHSLYAYPFLWEQPPYAEALGLGLASFINHSQTPNCDVLRDYERQCVIVITRFALPAGAELTYHYQSAVWFEVKE